MPIYKYQCKCGLQFEKSVKASKRQEPQKCVCGTMASWMMPKDVGVSFKPKVDGIGPQNTGVSLWDEHADRVIGEDARKKWAVVKARSQHKRELLRSNPEATGADIAKNPDGSYRIMDDEERKASDAATAARKLHYDVSALIKKKTGVDV